MLSGVGSIALMHPDGNFAGARAAGKFGIPLGVSSVAKQSMEDTAAAHPGMKLLQLYINGDEKWTDAMVDRIVAAKYDALVFSVDSAVFSRRERDIVTAGNNAGLSDTPNPFRAGLTWDKVKRVKDRISLPVGIKGITTAEDAEIACEMGCSVVWVSNHGGRQLDHARGSIDMLAEVAPAVRGRAAIVVDSGFQRGSDIVKALALGANVVGIGKLWGYAIGAGGEAGVTRLLELLEKEIIESMALSGVSKVADLNTGYIRPAPPVTPPGQFSAFPFLNFA
jgi:glycolate oxidase